jgi:hypothetical protein
MSIASSKNFPSAHIPTSNTCIETEKTDLVRKGETIASDNVNTWIQVGE